jgi:asparagine synthase (glutamine-hydrolysing)
MCGFAFICDSNLNFSNIKKNYKDTNLFKRGFDGTNFIIKNNEFYGHSRLAITDITDNGIQPFRINKHNLLFNGEIYNFKYLKDRYLAKLKLKSNSDTEVFLHLILKLGLVETLKVCDGTYSFLIFNEENNLITISRDIWGQKPLYYTIKNDSVVVSSSILFCRKSNKFCKIDKSSVLSFLSTGFIASPKTIYENINSVIPGEIIQIQKNKETWKIYKKENLKFYLNKSHQNKDYKKSIILSLERKLDVNQNYAFSFSGGIDSSILVALAKKELGINPECFHLNLENNSNELKNAQNISKRLDINLNIITANSINEDSTIDLLSISEQPIDNYAILLNDQLTKNIRKNNYKILISGLGADEYFGGYSRVRKYSKINAKFENSKLQQNVLKIFSCINLSFINKLTSFNLLKLNVFYKYNILRNSENIIPLSLINFEDLDQLNYLFMNLIKELDINIKYLNSEKSVMKKLDLYYLMPDFLSLPNDQATIINGVESRCPYLDFSLDEIFNNQNNIYSSSKKELRFFFKKILGYEYSNPKVGFVNKNYENIIPSSIQKDRFGSLFYLLKSYDPNLFVNSFNRRINILSTFLNINNEYLV